MRDAIRVLLVGLGLVGALPADAATFIVDSTANAGAGTLRQAILDANANVNVVDVIEFAIAGPPFTIQPTAPLPTITDPVTIDGYTQPGTAVNTDPRATNAVLLIEIDGSLAGDTDGLLVEHVTNLGAGTTIRGLVINGFNNNLRAGIRINDDGNNRIEGNFIGTDVSGLLARPNSDGISTEFFAAANHIGAAAPAARNLISGNSNRGVVLDTDANTVEGNLIGTDRSGVVALPNGAGIVLFNFAADNVIGGPGGFLSPAANTISGNANGAIIIGTDSVGHDILSNRIGPGADGLTLIGNGPGSALLIGASGATIVENHIAGNNGGIFLGTGGDGAIIQSNLIGLPMSGNSGIGISVFGANDALIGGATPDLGNLIAGNGGAGVQVVGFMGSGTGNAILQNQIYANGGLGIELQLGGNNGQPAPVLTGAAGGTQVQGTLTAAALTTYRIEFFANTLCDTGGSGEGEIFIGSLTDTTDGAGVLAFDATVAPFPGRPIITATATDPANNTSQFSNCVLNPDAIARPSPTLGLAGLGAALLLLIGLGRGALGRRVER